MHKLYKLALTFPALEGCPTSGDVLGTGRFEPAEFAEWAARQNMSPGGVWAALFILSVWNDRNDWAAAGLDMVTRTGGAYPVGRFHMHDALGTWDPAHRAAFAAWTADAWWC